MRLVTAHDIAQSRYVRSTDGIANSMRYLRELYRASDELRRGEWVLPEAVPAARERGA